MQFFTRWKTFVFEYFKITYNCYLQKYKRFGTVERNKKVVLKRIDFCDWYTRIVQIPPEIASLVAKFEIRVSGQMRAKILRTLAKPRYISVQFCAFKKTVRFTWKHGYFPRAVFTCAENVTTLKFFTVSDIYTCTYGLTAKNLRLTFVIISGILYVDHGFAVF